MKVTKDHPDSSYGVPVFLDDSDQVMDDIEGLNQALKDLGWSRQHLADMTGKSKRTIDGYWLGRPIAPEVKEVLGEALKDSWITFLKEEFQEIKEKDREVKITMVTSDSAIGKILEISADFIKLDSFPNIPLFYTKIITFKIV